MVVSWVIGVPPGFSSISRLAFSLTKNNQKFSGTPNFGNPQITNCFGWQKNLLGLHPRSNWLIKTEMCGLKPHGMASYHLCHHICGYLNIYLPIYLSIYLSNTYYGLFNPEYITDWPRLFAISRWPLEPKEGSTAGSPRRFGRPHCALAQIAGGSPSKCLVGIFNWHFRNLNLLVGGLVAIFYFPIIWE